MGTQKTNPQQNEQGARQDGGRRPQPQAPAQKSDARGEKAQRGAGQQGDRSITSDQPYKSDKGQAPR
jgi:hypothetical protein